MPGKKAKKTKMSKAKQAAKKQSRPERSSRKSRAIPGRVRRKKPQARPVKRASVFTGSDTRTAFSAAPPSTSGFPAPVPPKEISELPFSYGETQMVLIARDPYWAYSYWDFSAETWSWIERKFSEDVSLKAFIRVSDLDEKASYDLYVALEAKSWYLNLGRPDHRFFVELALGDGRGKYYRIVRSNEVKTPRDSPSEVIDREWEAADFEEVYRLSGGGRGRSQSSPSSPRGPFSS